MNKTKQLMALATADALIQSAMTTLSQAQDYLENEEDVELITKSLASLDVLMEQIHERGEARWNSLKSDDRCPGCPGTEGGCCK